MEKGTKISMRENLVQLEKFWKIERKYSNQKRSFFALLTLDRHRKLCYYADHLELGGPIGELFFIFGQK